MSITPSERERHDRDREVPGVGMDQVQVEDVWQDCDPRRPRKVRVLAIEKDKAVVQAIDGEGPTSKIALDRLRPISPRRGFRLVVRDGKEVPFTGYEESDSNGINGAHEDDEIKSAEGAADDEDVEADDEADDEDDGDKNESDADEDADSGEEDSGEARAATTGDKHTMEALAQDDSQGYVGADMDAAAEAETEAEPEIPDEGDAPLSRTSRGRKNKGKRKEQPQQRATTRPKARAARSAHARGRVARTAGRAEAEARPRKVRKMSGQLNPNEQAVFRVMSKDQDKSLEQISGSARFPKKIKAKANSWTRNSMRKLIRLGLVKKVERGHYRLTGRKPSGMED